MTNAVELPSHRFPNVSAMTRGVRERALIASDEWRNLIESIIFSIIKIVAAACGLRIDSESRSSYGPKSLHCVCLIALKSDHPEFNDALAYSVPCSHWSSSSNGADTSRFEVGPL